MKLLRDKELISLVDRTDPIIKDLQKPRDWFSKDSPVQPSSIDLHIGSIFLPDTKKGVLGSAGNPLKEHSLKPGHTAVVVTLEEFKLPNNIVGIGFPPSRVSFKGVLMTNPGHVDPGYEGPMRFTVINMGKKHYNLKTRNEIVTVLLFELSTEAHKGWSQRRCVKKAGHITQENLDRLTSDFMEVEKRALKVINRRVALFTAGLTVSAAIIAALISGFFSVRVPAWMKPLDDVEDRILKVEQYLETTDRFDDFELRLKALEQSTKSGSSTQGLRSEDMQHETAELSHGGRQ